MNKPVPQLDVTVTFRAITAADPIVTGLLQQLGTHPGVSDVEARFRLAEKSVAANPVHMVSRPAAKLEPRVKAAQKHKFLPVSPLDVPALIYRPHATSSRSHSRSVDIPESLRALGMSVEEIRQGTWPNDSPQGRLRASIHRQGFVDGGKPNRPVPAGAPK